MIISKCPLRLSLVGGSTDLQGFIDKYGYGSVISSPVNLYTYISLNENITDNHYKINYSNSEKTLTPNTIKNDIAREVIQYFNLPPVIMSFNSDIPSSGSGLASSSSYLISAIAAASKFVNLNLSQVEICKLALELERKFNPLTGYQDPYGCGIGGLKQYIFRKNKISLEPLTSSVIKSYKMYLIPTNVKRKSTGILASLDYTKSFPLLEMVDSLRESLDDEESFFKVFNKAWITKKQTSNSIINSVLLEQEKALKASYSIKGLKLCGAGGGGYFLVFTLDNIKNSKLVDLDNDGVKVWKI